MMSADDSTHHELPINYRHNHPSAVVATAIERQEYASTTNPIAYSTRTWIHRDKDMGRELSIQTTTIKASQSMLWPTTGNHEHWIIYTHEKNVTFLEDGLVVPLDAGFVFVEAGLAVFVVVLDLALAADAFATVCRRQ
jgi:hypothetical protein